MKGRRIKRAKVVSPTWVCSSCFKVKRLYSRGMCQRCYQLQSKRETQARKEKAATANVWIAPRNMMHMNPGQIVANWKNILKGAGL